MAPKKPVVLCILDGWGYRETAEANAVALAHTPNFDRIFTDCPHAFLTTHGPDAGLPSGQMGNSEVGHTNIGAGRVVAMDLGQIDLAIENGSFFDNAAIRDFAAQVKAAGGTAHLMGLTSSGGVHSHEHHIISAAQALAQAGVPVAVHVITDGRDVAPHSAAETLPRFQAALPKGAQIVTVTGRYYAMDRDNRWDRVERAYTNMICGDAPRKDDMIAEVSHAYADGKTDEFIEPFRIGDYGGAVDGDGVFFINFRADRAREILSAIGDPDFSALETGSRPSYSAILGMVDYSARHSDFMTAAYPKQEIVNTLGSWVAAKGLRQFRLAETEKYPHVTFFLNGGKETPETGEERHMAPSPKVATYDQQPEMSADEVGDHLVSAIKSEFDLIVVNFANPDMVGHTGDLNAAIAACEAVDHQLGRAVEAMGSTPGAMIVTADHGNCETMVDPQTGGPHTAHTTNPVPVILVGGPIGTRLRDGRLADLAPTVLALMDLDIPAEMTGECLLAT